MIKNKIMIFLFLILFACNGSQTYAFSSGIDEQSLMNSVDILASRPRGYANSEIEYARAFIVDAFTKYGLDIELQEFETDFIIDNEKYKGVNIIGTLKPNTSKKTADVLIIGAHYDGFNDTPAADDNASGVSVMLELVRILHNVPSDTEIRFVAFDAEEIGLCGSTSYIESIKNTHDNIVAMLNFDMVGSKESQNISVSTCDGDENFLIDILKHEKMLSNISLNPVGISDNVPFYLAGIPTVMFSHNLLTKENHSKQDTIDNIDSNRLVEATELGKTVALRIMDEQTPSYLELINLPEDDTTYYISDDFKLPNIRNKTEFENFMGVKVKQTTSEGKNAKYICNVKMFDMPEPLLLTLKINIWDAVSSIRKIPNIQVDMCGANIPLDRLYSILTERFGPPIQKPYKGNGVTYCWNSIYGNSYVINVDEGNTLYNFEMFGYYKYGVETEGYTLNNEQLSRMETASGYNQLLLNKKNGEVIKTEILNRQSNILKVTEYASNAWEKLRNYLSHDEINQIGFISFFTDGINGEKITISNPSYGMKSIDDEIALYMENFNENSNYTINYPIEGLHISIDYIDLLNPLGSCYYEKDLLNELTIAQISCASMQGAVSNWAKNDIILAITNAIFPESLYGNYKDAINGEEFCNAIVNFLQYKGLSFETHNPQLNFANIDSTAVNTLYELGIIDKNNKLLFSHEELITREQAAIILNRTLNLFFKQQSFSAYIYLDDTSISSYAKESVYSMYGSGIMIGIGNDSFEPNGTFTREQAIVALMRLNEYIS